MNKTTRTTLLRAPTLLALFAVAGTCGGGGGAESGGGDDGGDACALVPDLNENVPYCSQVIDCDEDLADLELMLVDEINAFRQAGGSCGGQGFAPLPALSPTATNWCAARNHARDMNGDEPFMSDRGSDGTTPGARLALAGSSNVFEQHLVGFGFTNPKDLVKAWERRSELCERMVDDTMTEIGVGVAPDTDGSLGLAWAVSMSDF